MKIENGPTWIPAGPAPAVRPTPAPGAPSFGRVLEELRRGAPSAEAPRPAVAPRPAADAESAALQGLEASLDLLERYREGLAQSRFRLRDLEPLVASLEAGLPDLERRCAALPPDSGIKPLLREAAVLGAAEAARFRRGDYLDA